ncbi:NADH-cytochrome b5 reductase-like [Watersipora subatra]|uniref:NADH-cytochrome b5 reductase-like n=1 Tax=Watersipora subatra TaxID=2589382 RepID=UPI00355C6656
MFRSLFKTLGCRWQMMMKPSTPRNMADKTNGAPLPPKPTPLNDADCCDSGCETCVKDIYLQELKIWEEECNKLLLAQAPRSSLSPDVYMKCPLVCLDQLTHNTYLYTFDSRGFVQINPGQHLILREVVDGATVTRQYTPIAVPRAEDHTFKVMIKMYDHGTMTSHIKRKWKLGDEMDWRGPHGLFQHQCNQYMKYVILAAGTGIAPMLRVAQSILNDDNDITTIKLLYACKNYEDILLKDELRALAQHWNFTFTTYLSQDVDGDLKRGYGENVVARKLESDDILSQLSNKQSTRILISGTKEYDTAMLQHCQLLQIPSENIYKF